MKTYFYLNTISGLVKIGRSEYPSSRRREIESVSGCTIIMLGELDGDREHEMHVRFSRYRVVGEWFRPEGEMAAFLKSAFSATHSFVRGSARDPYPSLTDPQVAERLRISLATLYRLRARGEGPPSYRVGKRRLSRESDVLDWLENECREGGAA